MGIMDSLHAMSQSAALDVQKFSDKGGVASARLCNFVTGRSELQFGHKYYLGGEFKNAIEKHNAPWVRLIGFASRKGSSAKNLKLSKERMEAVGLYIADLGLSVQFDKVAFVGSEQSGEDASNNDGYYRAVEVYVYGTKPPPLPVEPAEVVDKQNKWALRYGGGGSLNIGPVQVDGFAFEIGNFARKVSAKFIYGGIGVGLGIPLGKLSKIPGGASTVGKWAKFTTDRTTALSSFATAGSIVGEPGVTLGDFSIGDSHLEFIGLSDSSGPVRVIGNTVRFSGGPGFALPSGGALTGGKFTMVGKLNGFDGKD